MKVLYTLLISTWSFIIWAQEWPIEYIKVDNIEYPRNSHASFCKRPVEMVDTIVIHHSETPSTDTPEMINELHLSRGTPTDPWYMIAYSYVINSPYKSENIPISRVSVGRPMDLVGAHAGSDAYVPMSDFHKKVWSDGKITCGKENTDFQINPNLVRNNLIKANVTTIGVVVIGNYAPFSRINPGGFSKTRQRHPTEETQELLAKLACQLQKKYENIKFIKWHNYYHDTTCPGSIKKYINKIRLLARNYGCEFK